MTILPCPKCKKNSGLGIKSGKEPDSLVIDCEYCGYEMQLETKLPTIPQKIMAEWNRRVGE